LFVVEQSKNLECGDQQIVIERFIFHPLIKNMVLNYFSNLTTVKQNQEVVSSLKLGITNHLIGERPSQFVVVKDIVCMLASS
jgi:hypothetical protein